MAADGRHGNVRLDGGITSGRGSATRDSVYFSSATLCGLFGVFVIEHALISLQICLAG
jgi:hypothetical protein